MSEITAFHLYHTISFCQLPPQSNNYKGGAWNTNWDFVFFQLCFVDGQPCCSRPRHNKRQFYLFYLWPRFFPGGFLSRRCITATVTARLLLEGGRVIFRASLSIWGRVCICKYKQWVLVYVSVSVSPSIWERGIRWQPRFSRTQALGLRVGIRTLLWRCPGIDISNIRF